MQLNICPSEVNFSLSVEYLIVTLYIYWTFLTAATKQLLCGTYKFFLTVKSFTVQTLEEIVSKQVQPCFKEINCFLLYNKCYNKTQCTHPHNSHIQQSSKGATPKYQGE